VLRYQVYKETPPVFKDNVFIRDVSDGVLRRIVYIKEVMPRSGEMKDVMVQEFEGGHVSRIISAPTGYWIDGQWWLVDGQVFEVRADGMVNMLFRFERQKLNLEMEPSDIGRDGGNPDEMNLKELYVTARTAAQQGNDSGKLKMLLYLRIAVPWASVVLVIVGAAVGSRPQRSSAGMGLGLSVVIVFCYYVIMSLCKSLGEAAFIPGIIAAWIPNVVFFAIGLFMVRRANRLG
jgi:lipopolysaccharide export system permease protein